MKSTFVEVTNGPCNWGKFLVCQYTKDEIFYSSLVGNTNLLNSIGDSPDAIWILDLQTGEGARFYCRSALDGSAECDLKKHKIWVCPLFEPFLQWLYQHPDHCKDVATLPGHIEILDAPFALRGYRRAGDASE